MTNWFLNWFSLVWPRARDIVISVIKSFLFIQGALIINLNSYLSWFVLETRIKLFWMDMGSVIIEVTNWLICLPLCGSYLNSHLQTWLSAFTNIIWTNSWSLLANEIWNMVPWNKLFYPISLSIKRISRSFSNWSINNPLRP
jgi:hypothetical protein